MKPTSDCVSNTTVDIATASIGVKAPMMKCCNEFAKSQTSFTNVSRNFVNQFRLWPASQVSIWNVLDCVLAM